MGQSVGRVLVPLAPGFEDIELVAIADILRRAGLEVRLASLAADLAPVTGAYGACLVPDALLADQRPEDFVALVLPGGGPGTAALRADARVLELVRAFDAAGKTLGAICAAPTVLAAAGALEGRAATAHQSVRAALGPARVVEDRTVVGSGHVLTSQGAGTAVEFALCLVARLVSPELARDLAQRIHAPAPRLA
jgi:4-methyl-5(b-hydroxyethyl)-thiazole monophosphate biosynthesis